MKHFLFCSLSIFLFSFTGIAQICGTAGNAGIGPNVVQRGAAYNDWNTYRSGNITYVKLKVRIGSNPGPGGDAATLQDVQRALDIANEGFLPGNIQFVLCGPVQIVEDNALWFLSSITTLNNYHEYGYINVSVFNYQTLVSGASGFTFPDHVCVQGTGLNSTTLAHELGHALGLYHTHDNSFGAELVNGSNCITAGDLICDTPADPNLGLTGMVSYPGCLYTGTATDANSQAYSPLVNNFMSYAPKPCRNSFTTQQFNEMNYVLDSVKTYLRKTVSPVLIDSFPALFCTYNAPVTLTATPAGGTFNGMQVTGSVLDPQNGPPATYDVHYVPSSLPDTAHAYIDQYSYQNSISDTLNDVWQSFTARENGNLSAIDFYIRNLSAGNFTFSVYAGTGTGGTLLYTSIIPVGAMTAAAWTQFSLGSAVATVPGNIYTAQISSASPGFEYYHNVTGTIMWYDCYLYGQSNTAGRDLVFRQWVTGIPSCQDAYRYYYVYVPPQGQISNLASDYCQGEDTLVIKGNLPTASVYIDGNAGSLLIPSALSVGAHQVEYISSSLGCYDTASYSFNVLDGQAVFTNTVSPVCADAAAYMVSVFPPGGNLLIDAASDSVFDAAALGAGMHYLTYSNNLSDTVVYSEQECCGTGINQNFTPKIDSVNYQVFKANQSGLLSAFNAYCFSTVNLFNFETKLYKGAGITGSVLICDTVPVPVNGNGWNWVNMFHPSSVVNIDDDSVYTFSFKRLPDAFTTNLCIMAVRNNNPYPAGISNADTNLNARDFYFQEIIKQYTGCSVNGTDSILVNNCTTGSNDLAKSNLNIFPNPVKENYFYIENFYGSELEGKIFDNQGRMLQQVFVLPGKNKITLSGKITPGIYFIKLENKKNKNLRVAKLIRTE